MKIWDYWRNTRYCDSQFRGYLIAKNLLESMSITQLNTVSLIQLSMGGAIKNPRLLDHF